MQHYPWAPPRTTNPHVGMMGQPMGALGPTGTGVLGLVLLGLAGALSYYAGAAMAPSRKGQKTWGLVGIPVGLLTGPIGLGVMGVVSMNRK